MNFYARHADPLGAPYRSTAVMKYKPVFSVSYSLVSNEGDFNESGFVAEDVGLRTIDPIYTLTNAVICPIAHY